MIAGSDFVADLLALLDILAPVVDLMLRAQSLDTPVWKLKLWWPKVKAKLTKAANGCATAFERLEKAGDFILPGGSYKGVPLLEGWLVTNIAHNQATAQKPDSRFTWEMREEIDVKEDHKCHTLFSACATVNFKNDFRRRHIMKPKISIFGVRFTWIQPGGQQVLCTYW